MEYYTYVFKGWPVVALRTLIYVLWCYYLVRSYYLFRKVSPW